MLGSYVCTELALPLRDARPSPKDSTTLWPGSEADTQLLPASALWAQGWAPGQWLLWVGGGQQSSSRRQHMLHFTFLVTGVL